LDLVDCTMQSLAFLSGTFAGAMQRCNIAIRRLNPIWNSAKRRGCRYRWRCGHRPHSRKLGPRPLQIHI
jgi:hypothetical protein